MSDEGALNVGVICGKIFRSGAPVEAHVSLLSVVAAGVPQDYWSKIGGPVGAVYSNKDGEYAIYFYWDATSPEMIGAHFRVRALHKYANQIAVVDGVLNHRVNLNALAETTFDKYLDKFVIDPPKASVRGAMRRLDPSSHLLFDSKTKLGRQKVKGFLKKAKTGVSGLKRSTASVVYTPELYAVFAALDIHLA